MKHKLIDMLKTWLNALSGDTKKTTLRSPWKEYEALSLIPLEELEEMIKKEEQEVQAKQKRAVFSDVMMETTQSSAESNEGPHVADLSSTHHPIPVITCFTIDDSVDPNLRITHYPPSNALH